MGISLLHILEMNSDNYKLTLILFFGSFLSYIFSMHMIINKNRDTLICFVHIDESLMGISMMHLMISKLSIIHSFCISKFYIPCIWWKRRIRTSYYALQKMWIYLWQSLSCASFILQNIVFTKLIRKERFSLLG